MQQSVILLLCTLLFATSGSELYFSALPRPGKDYALFIAVNNYQNPKLTDFGNPQGNPKKDAQGIEQLLKDLYGFSTERLIDPTTAEITSKLEQYERDFRTGAKDPNGQLLLFFSGHGDREYSNGYFLATDSDPTKLYEKTIPYAIWRPRIASFNCKHIMVVIDACYSGTFDPNWFNRPKSYGGRHGELGDIDKLLANYDTKKTRMFFTSATEVQSPEISSFAKQFKEGLLSGGGADGILTSTELFTSLELSSPRPHRGEFEQDEAGSAYLFFSQASNNPNPDTDRDGISNANDRCPDQFGPASNNGCPLPPPVPAGMVLVQGGTFQMGDVMGDKEEINETVHTVTLSNFILAKNELTFDEFDAFCQATGRTLPDDEGWGRGKRPVINVDWYDAVEYCNWRSSLENLQEAYTINKDTLDPNNNCMEDDKKWLVRLNLDANGYRLPTEAEWEFAARAAGKKVRFGNSKDTADPREINFNATTSTRRSFHMAGEYRGKSFPVGSFSPNAIGLFDMSGNVWEWCWDWYDVYPDLATTNPLGPTIGTSRVVRGGAWYFDVIDARATGRGFPGYPMIRNYVLGFRLARTAILP